MGEEAWNAEVRDCRLAFEANPELTLASPESTHHRYLMARKARSVMLSVGSLFHGQDSQLTRLASVYEQRGIATAQTFEQVARDSVVVRQEMEELGKDNELLKRANSILETKQKRTDIERDSQLESGSKENMELRAKVELQKHKIAAYEAELAGLREQVRLSKAPKASASATSTSTTPAASVRGSVSESQVGTEPAEIGPTRDFFRDVIRELCRYVPREIRCKLNGVAQSWFSVLDADDQIPMEYVEALRPLSAKKVAGEPLDSYQPPLDRPPSS
jgi:hypothetical protein